MDSDGDDDSAIKDSSSLSEFVLTSWTKRCENILSSYAITAWALSVVPEIRAEVVERLEGEM